MIKVLVLGKDKILNLFRLFYSVDCEVSFINDYKDQKIDEYDLIITNCNYLDSISNSNTNLVINVSKNTDNLAITKNYLNLVIDFNYNFTNMSQDLDSQFFRNPVWKFYYRSCEKNKVKFLYDFFSMCKNNNKIKSSEILFLKI